jgi:hypothetical protein
MAPATWANDLPLETAGDRCKPLGSDGMWTKRGPDQTPQVAGQCGGTALQQQAQATALASVRWSRWLVADITLIG